MARLHILPGARLVTHVTVGGNTTCLPVVDPRRDNYTNQITNLVVPYQSPHYQSILIDPLETALAWVTPLNQNTATFMERVREQTYGITHSALRARLWDRQELLDWIEANCAEDVFMQWSPSAQWQLTFLGAADLETFTAWWRLPKPHPLMLRYKGSSDLALIEQWISEHISGEIEHGTSFQRMEQGGFKREYRFRRVEDAVMVKLRFSEMVTEASDNEQDTF